MNAIEHGNKNDPDLPVDDRDHRDADELRIRITDHGGGAEIPEQTAPDLDAKLARRADAARLGAVPDQEHGRRDERDERRRPPHGRTRRPPERGSQLMAFEASITDERRTGRRSTCTATSTGRRTKR